MHLRRHHGRWRIKSLHLTGLLRATWRLLITVWGIGRGLTWCWGTFLSRWKEEKRSVMTWSSADTAEVLLLRLPFTLHCIVHSDNLHTKHNTNKYIPYIYLFFLILENLCVCRLALWVGPAQASPPWHCVCSVFWRQPKGKLPSTVWRSLRSACTT